MATADDEMTTDISIEGDPEEIDRFRKVSGSHDASLGYLQRSKVAVPFFSEPNTLYVLDKDLCCLLMLGRRGYHEIRWLALGLFPPYNCSPGANENRNL